MWALFLSYCQTNKITKMSKVIEDAAQDFAAINDDKAANSAHSYSKYDIADAYQQGADFGYSLAENRIKKEYEENERIVTEIRIRPSSILYSLSCRTTDSQHYEIEISTTKKY